MSKEGGLTNPLWPNQNTETTLVLDEKFCPCQGFCNRSGHKKVIGSMTHRKGGSTQSPVSEIAHAGPFQQGLSNAMSVSPCSAGQPTRGSPLRICSSPHVRHHQQMWTVVEK